MPPKIKIAFLGDSITAGYGLHHSHSYPSVLSGMLNEHQVLAEITNAGISGDTTADGARRIGSLLKGKPDLVVVALGANDMLRGVPLIQVRNNLTLIIEAIQTDSSRCLLLGMNAGPFHGMEYMVGFNSLFSDLAEKYSVPYLPFFIEDIALRVEYNQADGLHPNAAGQRKIAEKVGKFLLPHLRSL